MKSLLKSHPLNASIQDRAHNSLNGSDAESFAMAKFLLACRGEGEWGSREDDNTKIDMILSCPHPWVPKERMLILTQVKSGDAYGHLREDGFVLKRNAKSAAIRTSHNICVIWVDRDSNKLFWAYIHPDSIAGKQDYGAYHEVSPATIFDIARCMQKGGGRTKGAKGLIIRKRDAEVTQRRKTVRAVYSNFQERALVWSPVLGKIELTRTGWRHMFRSGRKKENKEASLNIIPYLSMLLKRFPSYHAITDSSQFILDKSVYSRREHILKFDDLTVFQRDRGGEKGFTAHIRLIEEIRYPSDWSDKAMLSQLVERRVVLKSAYYKKSE